VLALPDPASCPLPGPAASTRAAHHVAAETASARPRPARAKTMPGCAQRGPLSLAVLRVARAYPAAAEPTGQPVLCSSSSTTHALLSEKPHRRITRCGFLGKLLAPDAHLSAGPARLLSPAPPAQRPRRCALLLAASNTTCPAPHLTEPRHVCMPGAAPVVSSPVLRPRHPSSALEFDVCTSPR
jgi:hypothetical protein